MKITIFGYDVVITVRKNPNKAIKQIANFIGTKPDPTKELLEGVIDRRKKELGGFVVEKENSQP